MTRAEIFELLVEFSNYPDDWAGMNSCGPSTQVINNTIEFFSVLPDAGLNQFDPEDFYCSLNGTICVDFIQDEITWVVEIGKSYFASFSEKGSETISRVDMGDTKDAARYYESEFLKHIIHGT